jgi:hypothetical protein
VATNVSLNGTTYAIPETGNGNWGSAVSAYLIALSTGVLAKTGGSFTLTADVDFGATYGLKATKFASRNTPATTGVFRAGNNEALAWRNAANSADLALKVNASNVLEFNGNPLVTLALGTANHVLKMNSGATAYEWGLLANANVDASAAIARSKLAAGTASHVVVNDGSGNFSSEATLAKSRGGTGADNSSVTFPTTGTVVTRDATETLTNKTIDADSNTLSNIANAAIKAGAAIARSKLGTGTASHVVVNDGSGNFSSEATLAKSRGGTGQDNSSLTFPASGTLVEVDATQTLTNKTLSGAILSSTTETGNGASLRFMDSDGSNYAGFKANNTTTADVTYTLPAAGPGSDGQVLSSTQLGVMSWVSPLVNPLDGAGQLIYGGASGTLTKLAAGTANYLLQSNGTSAPSWVTALSLGSGGSAATPQYGFDGGTGWYSDADGTISGTINGTKRFGFDFASSQTSFYLLAADTGQARIYFGDAAAPTQAHIGFSDNSGNWFVNNSGNNDLDVDSSGKVTLGTSSSSNVTHLIQNNTTSVGTATIRNHSTSTSADALPGLQITKGSTTNTSSQWFIYFSINAGATGSGYIGANGASQAAFASSSDERLKENIVDLPSQLANICALRPVEFDYKDGSGHQVGFVAQEMQQVYPDVVREDRDGYLTVSGWDKTSSRLVAAIKELNAKVEALEARVAVLEGA